MTRAAPPMRVPKRASVRSALLRRASIADEMRESDEIERRRPSSAAARRRRSLLSAAAGPTDRWPVVLNQPPRPRPRTVRPAALERERPLEPRRVAARLKQLEQPDRSGMRSLRRSRRSPLRRRDTAAAAAGLWSRHSVSLHEAAGALGSAEIASPRSAVSPARAPRARSARDHQAVPRGQDLVVEVRPRPLRARLEQRLSGRAPAMPSMASDRSARCASRRPRSTARCRAGSCR